ncbi:MAG TPA: cyclophilin-like fold protein [Desulfobacteraceae bacterium]|nr:cyclophilin-like fold protein [Desulfobacteraceae bacterium]HPJ68577.1 cyclophilin-like fold protein [Desulfobacteraceae bacterium]HPQ30046.1 cyclophilin-like fold protein [Desulfobacteraceae bacterium]
MSTPVEIQAGNTTLRAELDATPTAKSIVDMLPMTVQMSRWGDEYYGSIGRTFSLESDARDLMKVGELAYWPQGQALCIFFGPTPMSSGSEPVAASAVNPVGRIVDDITPLREMGSSVTVELRKV